MKIKLILICAMIASCGQRNDEGYEKSKLFYDSINVSVMLSLADWIDYQNRTENTVMGYLKDLTKFNNKVISFGGDFRYSSNPGKYIIIATYDRYFVFCRMKENVEKFPEIDKSAIIHSKAVDGWDVYLMHGSLFKNSAIAK